MTITGSSILARISTCFLFLVLSSDSRTQTSLADYFDKLPQAAREGRIPTLVDVLAVLDPVKAEPAASISKALPSIARDLHDSKLDVRKYAGLALYVIAQRDDSADLLGNMASVIVERLHDPDDDMKRGLLLVIAVLRPAPPASIISPLLVDLGSPEFAKVGPTLADVLIRIAPDRPDVVEGVRAFLVSPNLQGANRVDTLQALQVARVKSPILISEVARNALDPYETEVRLQAIETLGEIGSPASVDAMQTLKRIATDEHAAPDVRAAAQLALRSIRSRKN